MLTREEDVDAHALSRQGWTISAIARHLGRDRKTIRDYLAGNRTAGERVPGAPDAFAPFIDYVTARLKEDPHLWAVTLLDELQPLGFTLSYPTLTRQIRLRGLRPACEPCRPAKGRPVAVIDHPAGEETQWDWLELPDPPAGWGWGNTAHLLVGALSHSSRWRGYFAEDETFPQLVAGLDVVSRQLGGLSRSWRFDRMATVVSPNTGRITAAMAGAAKHYGVSVALCQPRRGNRKGVVEKANHTAAQRFWRTLGDDVTVEQAQAALDVWCARRGDSRLRPDASGTGGKVTVGVLAGREPLAPVGLAYPAQLAVSRVVSAQALVAFPRQLLLRRTRARRSPGDCRLPSRRRPPRHSEHRRGCRSGGARPAPTGSGWCRGVDPHRVPCHRPGRHRHGSRRLRAAASPQGTHPTRASIPGGCRRPVRNRSRRRRHRPQPLCRCRGWKEHPAMTTPIPSTRAQAAVYQQLRGHLAALKLHDAAEHLPAVLDAATAEGLSLTAALERLLAIEVNATDARRLAGRLRFASLPTPATLEDFDYDAAKGVDRKLIAELATCRYLQTATNVLLSDHPAPAKPISPSAWHARPPKPATAPTSPPPPTLPPAATALPSKDDGPPPCAITPDQRSS